MFVTNLCVCKSKIYTRATSFDKYIPLFLRIGFKENSNFRNIHTPVRALPFYFRNRNHDFPSRITSYLSWSQATYLEKWYFACSMHFQFHNHDLFDSSLELNCLIQNSVQQDYHLEIYPLPLCAPDCIPPFTKRQKNWVVLIKHSWISLTLQRGWG